LRYSLNTDFSLPVFLTPYKQTVKLQWLKRLLGSDKQNSEMAEEQDNSGIYQEKIDVLAGSEFFASLRILTPLSVLDHHGELFKGPQDKAPSYASPADGLWIPKTKTWEELGFDLEEMPQGQCASDIGPVLPEEYLPFLKAFRRIVESNKSVEQKISLIRDLQNNSENFKGIFKRLGDSYGEFPENYFYLQLMKLPGVGKTTARNLFRHHYHSIDQVLAASEEELTQIPGIGKNTARKLRATKPDL